MPLHRGGSRLCHCRRHDRIRPAVSRRTTAPGRTALSSLLSRAQHCRRCQGSPAAAPSPEQALLEGSSQASPPAQLFLQAHQSHTDLAYTVLARISSSAWSPTATKGFRTGGHARHKLRCRARGRAGEDQSPRQRLSELPAPPEPRRHRNVRCGCPHTAWLCAPR